MQVIYSVLIAIYGFMQPYNAHDIHVSVTDIEISDSGEVEVVVKVFLDDLMLSMGLELGAELPDDYTSSDDLINKFLEDNLSVKINGQDIAYQLEDTTPSSPAVWITLLGQVADDISSIEIDNKILIDHFDDQSNMINVSHKGKRYSELLDGESTTYIITVGK